MEGSGGKDEGRGKTGREGKGGMWRRIAPSLLGGYTLLFTFTVLKPSQSKPSLPYKNINAIFCACLTWYKI